MNVDLGSVSVEFDQKGKVKTTIGVIEGDAEFDDLGATLKSMRLNLKKLKITLSDFTKDSVKWQIHYVDTI